MDEFTRCHKSQTWDIIQYHPNYKCHVENFGGWGKGGFFLIIDSPPSYSMFLIMFLWNYNHQLHSWIVTIINLIIINNMVMFIVWFILGNFIGPQYTPSCKMMMCNPSYTWVFSELYFFHFNCGKIRLTTLENVNLKSPISIPNSKNQGERKKKKDKPSKFATRASWYLSCL